MTTYTVGQSLRIPGHYYPLPVQAVDTAHSEPFYRFRLGGRVSMVRWVSESALAGLNPVTVAPMILDMTWLKVMPLYAPNAADTLAA